MRKMWRMRSPSAQYLNVSQTLDEDAESVFESEASDKGPRGSHNSAVVVSEENSIQLDEIAAAPSTSRGGHRLSKGSTSSRSDTMGPMSSSVTSAGPALRSSLRRSREASLRVSLDLDPGILMVETRAHQLDEKYRYHAFVFYHHSDRQWVLSLVRKLESPPYNFKCCYDLRDFYRNTSVVQNTVCAMMLSERIILAVSPTFVAATWREYEDTLIHLTALTQRKQRVIPILLEAQPTDLPEPLRNLSCIQAASPKHWEQLLMALRHDGISASDSTSTMWSVISQTSAFSNGHIVGRITCRIKGTFVAGLLIDRKSLQDCGLEGASNGDIEVMLVAMGIDGSRLPCQFSAIPTLLLLAFSGLWCASFLLVIFLLPDSTSATLPVRLCVFVLPAAVLLICTFLRWRTLQQLKYRKSRELFLRSVHVNKDLYAFGRTLIITCHRCQKDDGYRVSIIFYSIYDCVEHLKLFLAYCRKEEFEKLARLIDVYTLTPNFLIEHSLAERLAVMLSSAYAAQFVMKNLPHPLDQRHTRRRQCLCQFAEDFLAAYLPMLRHDGAFDEDHLKTLFLRYLNCDVKPDLVVMRTLGIVGSKENT